MFSNPEAIKSSMKKKEYKNDDFNPYLVLDECGDLKEGKIHFLF